jgi:hypothetical protein
MLAQILLDAAVLVPTAFLLIRLSRWARSPKAQFAIAAWPPQVVVPLQMVIALFWFYGVYIGWRTIAWVIFPLVPYLVYAAVNLVQAVFLLVVIPSSLIIVGNAWMRNHPLPNSWSLGKIWVAFLAVVATAFALGSLPVDDVETSAGVMLILSTITVLFLTQWWIASHPIREHTRKNDDD